MNANAVRTQCKAKIPWGESACVYEAIDTVYLLQIWDIKARIELKKRKELTGKYAQGVQMFVETMLLKLNVDLSAKPPTWNTIEAHAIKGLKAHAAKKNREAKRTGDGERDGEGLTEEEQMKQDQQDDLYDRMYQQYLDWIQFKAILKDLVHVYYNSDTNCTVQL